jgi:threonine aldolase
MLANTYTHQVFPIVGRDALHRLEERAMFERWGPEGESGAPIRFVTTWQTTDEEIDALLELCKPERRESDA